MLERMGMALMRRMDPEAAHGLALKALNMGLAPLPGMVTSDRLCTRVASSPRSTASATDSMV